MFTRTCLTLLVVVLGCQLCTADDFLRLRKQMVAEEIEAIGVSDPRVLGAMLDTPRHEFVPAGYRKYAYLDVALPIGDQQTISPPYVVAYMTEKLDPQPTDRVLEIGTGSGYQAAVLSPLVRDVYTIEIVKRLGLRAERTLKKLGYKNVHVRVGDGFEGWPEAAPFDKIIVTCSPEMIPQPLLEQLHEEGQMIIPVGQRYQQNLYRVAKSERGIDRQILQATLFVPMTGTAEDARQQLPNPSRPAIVHGDFEEFFVEEDSQKLLPVGWHYLRGAEVIHDDARAPHGKSYLRFENDQPGAPSRALQGLAIDGRQVNRLKIAWEARGAKLRQGLSEENSPGLRIAFYDRRRAVLKDQLITHFRGEFPWTTSSKVVQVPPDTREAILRIGLLGGVGSLDLDALSMQAKSAN